MLAKSEWGTMTMRRFAILLLAGLPGAALGQGAEPPWQPIDFVTDEGFDFALDPASIAREGPRVTVRTRMQRREPSASGLFRTIVRWRYDCVGRTADMLGYEVQAADGEILETTVIDEDEREIEAVAPDTAHAAILRAVCLPES